MSEIEQSIATKKISAFFWNLYSFEGSQKINMLNLVVVGAMKKNMYTLGGIEGHGDGILNKVTESFSDKVIDV